MGDFPSNNNNIDFSLLPFHTNLSVTILSKSICLSYALRLSPCQRVPKSTLQSRIVPIDHQFGCADVMSVPNPIGLGYKLCLSPVGAFPSTLLCCRLFFQHWPRLPIAPFPSSARFQGYFHTASALLWVVFQHWLWLQITPFPLSAFPSRLFSYLRIVLPRLSHFTACCP